jgi:GntR family transcriptional repressor for pyruvate dehydrogenase complex
VSVVDEIVEYMTRQIISGEWPPGQVTPSLRTLARETGVSALTVREAIRTLQERGLVETRHGVGTFVRSPEDGEKMVPWMLGAGDVHDYVDLVEAREVIEAAIVRLAIERRTPEQVRQLHEIVDRMRISRTETAAFLEADTDFHVTLAEAAHNSVLLRSMLAMRGPTRRLMAARNLQHLETHGNLDIPVADHAAIVDAVERQELGSSEEALHRIAIRGVRLLHTLHDVSDEQPDGTAPTGLVPSV